MPRMTFSTFSALALDLNLIGLRNRWYSSMIPNRPPPWAATLQPDLSLTFLAFDLIGLGLVLRLVVVLRLTVVLRFGLTKRFLFSKDLA